MWVWTFWWAHEIWASLFCSFSKGLGPLESIVRDDRFRLVHCIWILAVPHQFWRRRTWAERLRWKKHWHCCRRKKVWKRLRHCIIWSSVFLPHHIYDQRFSFLKRENRASTFFLTWTISKISLTFSSVLKIWSDFGFTKRDIILVVTFLFTTLHKFYPFHKKRQKFSCDFFFTKLYKFLW